jgi:hypothetical protein
MFPISPGLHPSTRRRVDPMLIGATHLTVSVMPDAIHTHWRSPQSIKNYVASVHRRLRRGLLVFSPLKTIPGSQAFSPSKTTLGSFPHGQVHLTNLGMSTQYPPRDLAAMSNLQSIEDYIWAYSHMIKSV